MIGFLEEFDFLAPYSISNFSIASEEKKEIAFRFYMLGLEVIVMHFFAILSIGID